MGPLPIGQEVRAARARASAAGKCQITRTPSSQASSPPGQRFASVSIWYTVGGTRLLQAASGSCCRFRTRYQKRHEPAILGLNPTLRALPGASTTLQNHRRRFGWLANDVSRPSEPLEAARRHSKWSRDHPETTVLLPALKVGRFHSSLFRMLDTWVKLRPLAPSDRPDRPAPSLTILGCPPAL